MSIMQRGKQHNLTFAMDTVNWTKDFFDTFYKADPAWITVLRTTYSDRIETGNVTYNDFAKQAQEQDRTRPRVTGRKGFQQGAFNANRHSNSASDEDSNNENEKTTRGESQRGRRYRGGNRGGKRGNKNYQPARVSSGPVCIGCDMMHPVVHCFYLFPFLAPKGWIPNEARAGIVERNMRDKKIREEIEDIRKNFASAQFHKVERGNKNNKEEDSLI